MQLIDDFFTLIYNAPFDSKPHDNLAAMLTKETLDWYAIVLACNGRNFATYKLLDMFAHKCEQWNLTLSLDSVKTLQSTLLQLLLSAPSTRIAEEIITRITALRDAGILEYDEEQRIKSIVRQIRPRERVQVANDQDFGQDIATLQNLLNDYEPLLRDYGQIESVERIANLLSQQNFTIAITGVMSAGKSTLLNALLSQEILGTSVVPETANLTIISYAQTPKAVVSFWTESEWHNIEESAKFDDGIAQFVAQTREIFGDNLAAKLNEGSKEIATNELTNYTSAKSPQRMCNLIKKVQLYLPLDFLRDGVHLIDTPGLDDPLTQREEITKNYLLHCDVIVHLMNAAQSATKKDIDFMVDALANKNIARLLVVLTHADSINPNELQAIMDYTTNSFRTKLIELGLDERLTENLEFIPTSGYMALLHRTGRANEALEKGYDLDKTGIPALESALHNMLFGADSQKMRLIVFGALRHLLDCVGTILDDIALQKKLMHTSLEEIMAQLQDAKKAQEQNKQTMQAVQTALAQSRAQYDSQCDTLHKGIVFKLQEFQAVLKERVQNMFEYSYNHSSKPSDENLHKTITIGIQDAITEARRDFAYKLERALYFFFEEIREQLYRLALPNESIDSQLADYQQFVADFFAKNAFIDQTSVLAQGITHLNANHSASNFSSLQKELAQLFALGFEAFIKRANAWSEETKGALNAQLEATLAAFFAQSADNFAQQIAALENAAQKHNDQDAGTREKTLLAHEERLLALQANAQAILQKT